MLRQLRFRTVVLSVQMSAIWKSLTNFSVSVLFKWLKRH